MRIAIIVAAGLALAGCATGPFEWKYGQDKIVPGKFTVSGGEAGSEGAILTWPSHAVGAIVYPGMGQACIQSAQSAKARSRSGAGSVAAKSEASVELSASLAQAITEIVESIQDKNDVATFTDVALFQICTIAANRDLSNADTTALVQAVLLRATEIARARPNNVRLVTAPLKPDDATVAGGKAGAAEDAKAKDARKK